MNQIKNIILDLGGVIINLDILRTITAFDAMSDEPFQNIYTQLKQTPIFDKYDKGTILELEFFTALKLNIQTHATIDQMKEAWNDMLLDFPVDRLELLKKLKNRYRLFLLSNTNETHIKIFEKKLQQLGYINLEPFFETVYYSCRMGMRKPNIEIFEYVLQQHHLVATETIFIDDTQQHVDGAQKAGIQAHLLPKNKEVVTLLAELGINVE